MKNAMTKISFPLLLLLFAFCKANSQNAYSITAEKIKTVKETDTVFKKYNLINIPANEFAAAVKNKSSLTLRLHIDADKKWDINLTPAGITAPSYKLLLQTETGLKEAPSKPAYLFKGRINGERNSSVRMVIKENYLTASFFINDEEFFIEPFSNYDKTAKQDVFIFYNSTDVITPQILHCPVKPLQSSLPALPKPLKKPGTATAALCYTIPVVLMTDYQMLQQFEFNIDSLETFLLGNMNNVQEIFSGFDLDENSASDTGEDKMKMQVINCVISTCSSCDIISKTMEGSNLLKELDLKVKGNPNYPFYYITNYWTPRNLFNVTQGIGGISGLMGYRGNRQPPAPCDYYSDNILRYASANSVLLRFIAAHEMGHSFGCQHDNEIKPSVTQFIMNATAANPGASRFSRLSDFGGGSYSSSLRIKQSLNYFRDCLAGCDDNATTCAPLTGITINPITNNESVKISWNESKQCNVRLFLQEKDSLIVQEEKTVTGNSVSFTGLNKCRRYIVQVQPVCNAVPGVAVYIPVYSSPYSIDTKDINLQGSYYQLKIKLDGNTLTGSSRFFMDNYEHGFIYNEAGNLITVNNLFADGRQHKIEIKDINGNDTCHLTDFYKAPYGREDATVLLSADFNNCSLDEGWKDSVLKSNFIAGYTANKWHYANFSTPVLRTLAGTIDSSCMMYYQTYSPDNGCCGSLQITSPVKDISNYKNTMLGFDYVFDAFRRNQLPTVSGFRFEVFNGVEWIKVFERENTLPLRRPLFLRNSWDTIPPRVFIPLDIYRNKNFQVRLIMEDGVLNYAGEYVTGNLLAAFDNIKVDGYLSGTANNDDNFSVYPNPAADKIFISLNTALNTNVQYSFFDSKGALVSSGKLLSNSISTSFLSTGLYYLRLIKNNRPIGKPVKLIIHK